MYRLFNQNTGIHLYTADENERAFIEENLDNYVFEGTPYYGYDTQEEGTLYLSIAFIIKVWTHTSILLQQSKEMLGSNLLIIK